MLTNVGGCGYVPYNQETGIETENFVTKTGDVLTGSLHIENIPQQDTELTNKKYVDSSIAAERLHLNNTITSEIKNLKETELRDTKVELRDTKGELSKATTELNELTTKLNNVTTSVKDFNLKLETLEKNYKSNL